MRSSAIMPVTRAALAHAVALSWALLAAGCSSATQLIVVVDTDLAIPGALDDVEILVASEERGLMHTEHQPVASVAAMPLTLTLVPGGDFLGPIDVIATGSHAGTDVVSRHARVTLVRGETRMLRLHLLSRCVGVTCDASQSCGEAGCADVEIAMLEPWPGSPPGLRDAGRGMDAASLDATSVDAPRPDVGPVDAFGPDAGAMDAPSTPPDAIEIDAWMGCVSSDECDDGIDCTTDACVSGGCTHTGVDAMCDDGEICTDDRCVAGVGCSHPANTAACTDDTFCNGFDQCSGGTCSSHTGDPCAAPTVCDESMDRCRGCVTGSDCPGPSTGAWSACSYADTCTLSGTRSRTTRSYACVSGSCTPTDGTENDTCTRDTNGASCGAGSCGAYGSCDYTDACDETALQTRTCTDLLCSAGTCRSTPRTESMPCSRSTTGTSCGTTTCGSYGSCDYSDTCDESAMQTRTCTDRVCGSGSCGMAARMESRACSRTTTGTSCGTTTCGSYGSCDYSDACDQSASQTRTCTDRVCGGGSCGMASRDEMQACTRSTEGMSCGASLVCRSASCVSCVPTLTGGFTPSSGTMVLVTASGSTLTFRTGASPAMMGSVTASMGVTFTATPATAVGACFTSVMASGNMIHFQDDWTGDHIDVTVSGATVSGMIAPPCTPSPYGCFPQCLNSVAGSAARLNLTFSDGSTGPITFGCP